MQRVDKSPTILVSGLHRGESPQPGGAVIESVRMAIPQARFIGLSYDIMESGLHSDGPDRVDSAYLFPYPSTGLDPFLSRLSEVQRKENIALIIPTLDSELENLIRGREALEKMGIKALVPTLRSLQRREKVALAALGEAADVPTPQTFKAASADELARLAVRIGYPCYVKGTIYDARLVHTEAQLYSAFNDIAAVWGVPVLLQRPVYGEEYVVTGLGDGKGGLIGYFAMRKLLRTKLGKAYGAVVVDNPVLYDLSQRLMRELKWQGGFELEFVQTADGKLHLFEINPRFPAWISFPSKLGCNLPGYAAAHALGFECPLPGSCPAGKMFFRHNADIVGDIGDLASFATSSFLAPGVAAKVSGD
jgi:carbamoyl-phosphate synthase large subunit